MKPSFISQICLSLVSFLVASTILSSCSMGEEMRRIEESKVASRMREASRSTNLTGEQIFVRSCNTCHPGGGKGMGPSLISMETDFPSDESLKKLIRQGKGMMPSQPADSINEDELKNLVAYLRNLNADLKEKESR